MAFIAPIIQGVMTVAPVMHAARMSLQEKIWPSKKEITYDYCIALLYELKNHPRRVDIPRINWIKYELDRNKTNPDAIINIYEHHIKPLIHKYHISGGNESNILAYVIIGILVLIIIVIGVKLLYPFYNRMSISQKVDGRTN